MDLRRLTTFLEVAELGSLRRTSERLRIAETALSRQVRLLEEELGVTLFHRNGRGLTLTAEGQALRDRAAPMLQGLAQLHADIRSREGELSGNVTIGVPWPLLERLSVGLARRFIRRHTGVTIRFLTGNAEDLRDAMLTSEADLALIFDPLPAPGLALTQLLEEDMLLVGSRDAGYRLDRPVPFRRLAGLPLVLPNPRNPLRQRLEAIAAGRDMALNVRFEVGAMVAMKTLVAEGVAMMLASIEAVRTELAAGTLSAAPLRDPVIRRALYLAEPRARSRSLAALRLAEAVRDEVTEWRNAGVFRHAAVSGVGAYGANLVR